MAKFDWRLQKQSDLEWDGIVTTTIHPAVAARVAAQQAAMARDAAEQYAANRAAAKAKLIDGEAAGEEGQDVW